jgi:dTDP-4-dehydrorhamnose reductase
LTAPVVVIGKAGQLALALARLGQIAGRPVVCAGRPEMDLTRRGALAQALAVQEPALVINASAYTSVDKAESERGQAFAVNAEGVGALAKICAKQGVPLIHVSTDYVFDGRSRKPYREDAPIAPLGAYGASKAEGERLLRESHERHIIVRTAWVYSEHGANFLKTMLRLAAEREVVRVVNDQRGTPTYAGDLAWALATMAKAVLGAETTAAWGTYHFTNAGETTWHGFAQETFRLAAARGLKVPRLEPIATSEYPTPARRPAYSVLDTSKVRTVFGLDPPDWREALSRCLASLLEAPASRQSRKASA